MSNFDFMQTPPRSAPAAVDVLEKTELLTYISSLYDLIEKQRLELSNQRSLLRRMSAELMLDGRWKPVEQANEILGFAYDSYAVCLYDFAPNSHLSNEENKTIFDLKLRISDRFEAAFSNFCQCCSCESENSLGAILMNFSQTEVSHVYLLETLRHAVAEIEEELNAPVAASLSTSRSEIRDLPEAKEEALELLRLQLRLPQISPALYSGALHLFSSQISEPLSFEESANNHNTQELARLLCEDFLKNAAESDHRTAAAVLAVRLENAKIALGLGKQYEALSISSGERLRRANRPGEAFTVIFDFFDALTPALIPQFQQTHTNGHQLSLRIRRLVDESYACPDICLSFISARLGVTENKITKAFKKAYGIGVLSYIHHLRIQRAKELLLSTDRPVAEIYSFVGYTNRRTFDRVFKQYTGMTTGQFRSSTTSL